MTASACATCSVNVSEGAEQNGHDVAVCKAAAARANAARQATVIREIRMTISN
jgi:hypothetical protein